MFKLIFSVAAVTALAQVLQLVSQPLLTYLYTKESFGYLSIVMSIVTFSAIICNFQFNNLILISKENTSKLFTSGFFLSIILEIMVFGCLFVFSYHVFENDRNILLLLTIFYLLFYCFNTLFRAVMLKKEKNKIYSFGILVRSLVIILSQIVLSFFYESFGLIVGIVIGEFFLILYGFIYGRHFIKFSDISIKEILEPIQSEIKFLSTGTLQELTSTSMFLAPLILIIYKYSYEIGGEFSVVHKLAWGPAFLLAQVVSPILLQYISRENFKDIYLFDIRKSILFFCLTSLIAFSSASFIFSLLLKSNWYDAIWLSKYMVIWVLSFIVALPYRILIKSEKKQTLQFMVDLIILIIFLSIFIVNYSFNQYIILLTTFGVLGNFLIMLIGYGFSKKRGWI